MHLRPINFQKATNQLDLQYLFISGLYIIFKILTSFAERKAKNVKSQMSLKLYLGLQFLLKLAEIWTILFQNDLQKKLKEDFLKILIFPDFILTFIKKSRTLLFRAIKSKVYTTKAYKLTKNYKPARFTILVYFRSLHNFQNFDQLCPENPKM